MITIEEVRSAFMDRRRGRNYLLVLYYKELFANRKLTAHFIAQHITSHLGLPVNYRLVQNIRLRYRDDLEKQDVASPSLPKTSPDEHQTDGTYDFNKVTYQSPGDQAMREAMKKFRKE